MFRILLAVAAGGTISLIILSFSGSEKFYPWLIGFAVATVPLVAISIIETAVKRSKRAREEIAHAKQNGRTRAALILSRTQTGMTVNEQPEVDFTLLVDRPGKRPFIARTRQVVQLIDLHRVDEGALLAVAHSYSDYGNVHILKDQDPPTPTRELTPELAAGAKELPLQRNATSKAIAPIAIVAFVVGLVGAPFLATPNVAQYVQNMFSGQPEDVARIDHPVLFEASELTTSLENLTRELGNDEVVSVHVRDVRLNAEVLVSPESSKTERITMQDHQITDRTTGTDFGEAAEAQTFSLSEVNWEAVVSRIPEALEIAESKGLSAPELDSIYAAQDSSHLSRVSVWVNFADEYSSERVYLTPSGEITPAEQFALLPEEERNSYLYDADRFVTAVSETLAEIGATEIIQIINYGDRLLLLAHVEDENGKALAVRGQYREGYVFDVEEPESTKTAPEERFELQDLNWPSVFAGISEGQRIMTEAGVPDTQPTHIIIERRNTLSDEPKEMIARIYLSDVRNDGGYIEFNADGVAGRVMGL